MQASTEAYTDSAETGTGKKLCPATHRLARRGLSGEFGRQMENSPDHLKEQLPGEDTPPNTRYGHAAMLVAAHAPLNILPEQLIVGCAPYREAPHHHTPVSGTYSISHTTIGFEKVLNTGYRNLKQRVARRLAEDGLDDKARDLLTGMQLCLKAADIRHARYMDELEKLIRKSTGAQQDHYRQVYGSLRHVPENPPRTFREAVQSLWFMYSFQRMMGNWSGIGRIDRMLGAYLEKDLAEGAITLDEARELLAHLWINGTEWTGARDYAGSYESSGDAQHYQNIILSGIDVDGNDVTNRVTYLVLDIVAELHISDFPVAVRISGRTPDKLMRRIAEVQRTGGGIVSVYNEDVVIKAMVNLGIPESDAREFTNDGCWETLVPGRSAFSYATLDMLVPLQQALGMEQPGNGAEHGTFDAFYTAFLEQVHYGIDEIQRGIDTTFIDGPINPLVGLFVDDCIGKGRGYKDRGPVYNINAIHAGGMADAANSLVAIKKTVYDDQLISLPELVQVLRDNWASRPDILRHIKRSVPVYGNDDTEADGMMTRLFNDFTAYVGTQKFRCGMYRPAGISTFGREITWRKHRLATASGFKKEDILATNFNPTPGTDSDGPTATLSSYCKMDFTQLPSGGTLELRLHPTAVAGDKGIGIMVALLKTFVQKGGFYLCLDVADAAMLRDAQQHPDRYPNLVVRIAGWCARFHTLHPEWQEMIINRLEKTA